MDLGAVGSRCAARRRWHHPVASTTVFSIGPLPILPSCRRAPTSADHAALTEGSTCPLRRTPSTPILSSLVPVAYGKGATTTLQNLWCAGGGRARVLSPRRHATQRCSRSDDDRFRIRGRRCLPTMRPVVRSPNGVLRRGRLRTLTPSIVTQGATASQIESDAEPMLDPRNGESLECLPPRGGTRRRRFARHEPFCARSHRFNLQPPPRHTARVTAT
jgi:hypothetical protein